MPEAGSSSTARGRRPAATGRNFSLFSRHATGVELLLFDHATTRRPLGSSASTRSPTAPTTTGTSFVPGRAAGPALRLPRRTGRSTRTSGLRFDPDQGPARPVRPRRRRARRLRPRAAPAARRQRRDRDEERRRRPGAPTTGRATRRCAARRRRPIIYEMHVARLHPPPELRRRGRDARHLRRPDREDPVPAATSASPRSSCCRSSSSTPRTCPPGMVNYWGYQPVSFFAPHQRLQLAPGPARPGRRVPRHGQGAAPRRHRGHPRRRLQPHRRGRPRRPDALLPRPRQRDLLHPRAGPVALRRLHRLRQHAQRQPPDRPPADPRQPALLGRARCTSTASASTSRRSCRATRPASRCRTRRSSGTSRSDPALAGTKLIAEAWDAGRAVPGRQLRRRRAGRSGTAGSATTSAASSAASRARSARLADRLARQPRPLRPQAARGRAEHQLRHLPRRLHAQRPRLLQPASTTRRTARTTATAPNDNRSWNCGVEGPTDDPAIEALRNRQVKNFLAVDAAVARRADAPDGRRGAAHAARQQQRLLPGQRDQLVRLDAAREARRRAPLRRRLLDRAAPAARRRARAPAREPRPTCSRQAQQAPGTASSSTSRTGATTRTALAFGAELRADGLALPPDPERLLGAARLRAAAAPATAARGAAGSTRRSSPRRTSSPGRRRHRWPS